jgi:hypothetical protein
MINHSLFSTGLPKGYYVSRKDDIRSAVGPFQRIAQAIEFQAEVPAGGTLWEVDSRGNARNLQAELYL